MRNNTFLELNNSEEYLRMTYATRNKPKNFTTFLKKLSWLTRRRKNVKADIDKHTNSMYTVGG